MMTTRRRQVLIAACMFGLAVLVAPLQQLGAGEKTGSLVYLRDVAPAVRQDIRYAGADNFTGKPVPGYEAAECLLLRAVAEALGRVQSELLSKKLSLKVFDCYRPPVAVRAFADWVTASEDGATRHYYPRLERRQLIELGYISRASNHSRGSAVDLTIVDLGVGAASTPGTEPSKLPCNAPNSVRTPDGTVDMGTSFDCFDTASHTDANGISADAQRWRSILRSAMERQGFRGYRREWWHFSWGDGGPVFDTPVRAR